MKLRCSSLPLISRCGAALIQPAVSVRGDDAEARLGTAVHAALRAVAEGRDWSAADLASAAGVDFADLAALAVTGTQAWNHLRHWFPRAEAEVSLYHHEVGLDVTGHADVLSLLYGGEIEARVLDWKSGRVDADATRQLQGYAFLACESYHATRARACLVRLRDGTHDWFSWTREELRAWFDGLLERLRDRETYRPGAHCQYCPRLLECPAAGQLLRRAAYDLIELELPPDLDNSALVNEPARIADMLDFCRLLESRCQLARDLARACVAAAGGRLDCGDGRELVLVPQQRRQITVTPDSMDLVAAECATHQAYLRTLRFDKSAVEEAVRANAPRGQKGAAVKALMTRLDEAGAITTTTTERLECRRAVAQQLEHVHGSSTAAE